MLKPSVILACLLFISSIGTTKAAPLDAPGIVYMDGLPCNSACQSYMAWSQTVSRKPAPVASQSSASQQSPSSRVQRTTEITTGKATLPRVEEENKRSDRRLAKNDNRMGAYSSQAKYVPPEMTPVPTMTSSQRPDADIPTPPEQVLTAPPVQDLTIAVPRPEQNVDSETKPSGPTSAMSPADAKAATLAPPNKDALVAVVFVREEIKSVADLANKVVAIDVSDSVPRVRTAIVSAGAAEARLNQSQTFALFRLTSGEVPAAVVALASPEAAAKWTGVPGFNVLRIPLEPPAENAGHG